MKTRLLDLDQFLHRHSSLWRPQPFKESRSLWCKQYPELTSHLLALDDASVDQLERDSNALLKVVAQYIPALTQLNSLCALPHAGATMQTLNEADFGWEVPGRKKRQIELFSQAISSTGETILEWCGGKGHLGRTLGRLWQQPVETIEWNPRLCEEGRRLSARAGVNQMFYVEDALEEQTLKYLANKQVVALHACGDLHRQLIHGVKTQDVPALDIAPCCYHLGRREHYIPFNENLSLILSRDDLRLAVTGSETAPRAQLILRNQEMAWKLGYDIMRRQQNPEIPYRNIKPIEKRWLKLTFVEFCEKLAQRDEFEIPIPVDWKTIEQLGWLRQQEVMRLNLLRQLFRRAIELWLVMDMATFLQSKGYMVSVNEFCENNITPRNILLSARASQHSHR